VITVLSLACALFAQTETGTITEEQPPDLRNQGGSWIVGGTLGVAVGGSGTAFLVGASVGYAVVTGIVPGVRGVLLAGRGIGGEIAGTLTLSLPFDWSILPFVVGEGGHRWDRDARGWIYGGGGGVYIGSPSQSFGLQLGWIFRRYAIEDGPTVNASGPIVGISVAL
jgi:hypothetical protein